MRKLLLSLATISIIGIPAATVIACGTNSSINRFNTPVLGKKINDEIFMALLSDPTISPEIKGRYFNDIDFQKAATAMLEDQISKVANSYFQNGLNKSLMLNNPTDDFYNKKLDETINAIAQNQFYLEYTKNLVSQNGSSLDMEINIGNDNLIPLNPSKLLQPDEISDTDSMDNNKYFVFYQSDNNEWKRWEYFDENGDGIENIPQIKELENSKFVIVKKIDATNKPTLTNDEINNGGLIWLDGQTRHDDDKNFVYSLDGKTPYFMNGKVALQYRFQDYFRSQIRYSTDDKKSLAKRMLAITYLESNLFNVYRNEKNDSNQPTNDEYLNINSDVAQNIQSWNKTVGYQSKLKMIWSFTMNDANDAAKVWNLIRPYLNGNGQLVDSNFVSLKTLYQQIEATIINQSNLGSDPFFNLNGYNGIVKSGPDGIVSVDGNLLIDEAAKTKVQQINGPSILSEDGLGTPFKSNIKGKYDFVFVMPIYLIDLLNDKTIGYNHGLNTTIYAKKEDVKKPLDPNKVFTSYSEAQIQGNRFKSPKIDDINRALASSISNNTINNSYYIYDKMGASYSLNEWNQLKGKNYTPESVWDSLKDDSDADGLQVAIKNTHENTYGNIGINDKPVRLFKSSEIPTNPPAGITFSIGNDGYLYASTNKADLISDVQSFTIKNVTYYLSFDEATKEGVITTTGTINKSNSNLNNSTYGDWVNMGQNASDPNGYIKDDTIPFNYYEANITSLDIANLNTVNKTSLLREIESIVATDEAVINRASSTIYPLFLKESDILYEPLYQSLKKYLINEGGGTSD